MIEDHIGEWLVRATVDGALLTKEHRIESQIADRFVTHCGREMGHIEKTAFLFANTPEDQCKRC